MVWESAGRRGVDIRTAVVGREVNAGMPGYTAQIITDTLRGLGKDPSGAKVAVLGLAFKNNTGDLRSTPTRDVVEALREAGAEVSIHDPLVDTVQAEAMFGVPLTERLDDAVRDADCVAVLALHRDFEDIDFARLPVAGSCLVLDGRAYYSKDKIGSLRDLGYVYRGIGRGTPPGSQGTSGVRDEEIGRTPLRGKRAA